MKLSVLGNTFRITTEFTLEQMLDLMKLNSKANVLKDRDNNEIFAIQWGKSSAISDSCICFGATDEEGHLVCTILMESVPERKISSKVKKDYFKAIFRLKHLEGMILESIQQVVQDTEYLFQDMEVLNTTTVSEPVCCGTCEDCDACANDTEAEQITFDDVIPNNNEEA